ncbi:Fc.00g113490.m01.CDS01 [Cosmosporella sp. VM-42]
MDDGDLGETIDHEAQIVESSSSREANPGKFQNDDAHLTPSRWWFASSAFPMIAGTLGPVASAFSICALVRPWRQQLVSGGAIEEAPFVADLPWLTIVNAVQLGMALISNVFLLLNMARRVRFSVAQPVTIIGWYISAICLTALAATAPGPLLEDLKFPKGELILSQAFFYGVFSAILYFIDASLMAVTFWGASSGHYDKDFYLTSSQRTLMLQTIMFLMYLLVGALVFSHIEDWNYLDAVYWADITLFTVGFGDYSPQTTLGKALIMPYALVGVISLGLVIGSIRSLVLERGRRRVAARMEEKKRRKLVRAMARKGNDDILEPIREELQRDKPPTTEFERRQAEFELMRKIQAKSESRRRWMAMAISTSSWLLLWLVGAVIFESSEKPYQAWTYFESFYFCFTALTTIGYGDYAPISNAGKAFFVFWSLLALPTMTVLISNAGDTVVKFIRDGTLQLGNVTILPGDEDFVGELKRIISTLTCGRVFPDYRYTAAPDALNRSQSTEGTEDDLAECTEDSEEDQGEDRGRLTTSVADQRQSQSRRPQHDRAASSFTSQVRRSLSRLRNPHGDLPTGTDFHFLLISEIQVIAAHLKDSKPHKYTWEQWAWYLKLIGEDERNAETHRKAKPKEGRTDATGEDPEYETKWSWVGHRSPLMGGQEESEWILNRLMDKLRESLSHYRQKQLRAEVRKAHEEAQEVDHIYQDGDAKQKHG